MMQHILMVKVSHKKTILDNILKDRTYEIAKNWGYDEYQRALATMVYKVFDQKQD